MAICPHCQQTIRTTTKRGAAKELEPLRLDTSELTDREVYAYYKRTARREDLNFKIRNLAPWVSTDLREAYISLRDSFNAGHLSEREMTQQMARLDCRWRQEAQRLEDIARMFAAEAEAPAA